jgi:hypothetical protein
MLNLFQHPTCKVGTMQFRLYDGILKQVQDDTFFYISN